MRGWGLIVGLNDGNMGLMMGLGVDGGAMAANSGTRGPKSRENDI